MPELTDILRVEETGLVLRVKARPGIKKKRMPQIVDCGEGVYALEVTVADQATDGKANKALLKSLAAFLGVKRNEVRIKSGETSRHKRVEVCGDPVVLKEKMKVLLGLA